MDANPNLDAAVIRAWAPTLWKENKVGTWIFHLFLKGIACLWTIINTIAADSDQTPTPISLSDICLDFCFKEVHSSQKCKIGFLKTPPSDFFENRLYMWCFLQGYLQRNRIDRGFWENSISKNEQKRSKKWQEKLCYLVRFCQYLMKYK